MLRKILNTEKCIMVSNAIFPNWQAASLWAIFWGSYNYNTKMASCGVWAHDSITREDGWILFLGNDVSRSPDN